VTWTRSIGHFFRRLLKPDFQWPRSVDRFLCFDGVWGSAKQFYWSRDAIGLIDRFPAII
jgi:hypothetical protein